MSKVTEQEFIEIGTKMAQELQDCIADAEYAGCVNPFAYMKEIIDEWEAIYQRCDTWKNDIKGSCDIAN